MSLSLGLFLLFSYHLIKSYFTVLGFMVVLITGDLENKTSKVWFTQLLLFIIRALDCYLCSDPILFTNQVQQFTDKIMILAFYYTCVKFLCLFTECIKLK